MSEIEWIAPAPPCIPAGRIVLVAQQSPIP